MSIIDEAKKLKENNHICTNMWQEKRKQIVDRIINDDLTNFLNWKECIETFVVINEKNTKIEFDTLDKVYWKNILNESKTGNPMFASFAQYTSMNMIHYAYHIDVFQKTCNKNIKDFNSIIEFGGGYGGMCNLIRKMGFTGDYTIYDFQELNLLQKYYLEKEEKMEKTILTDNFSVFDKKYDLLIATWSLSESPLEIRDKVINSSNNFLMASQQNFEGIDNIKYFKNLGLNIKNINHLPMQFYIMGEKK